MKDPCEIIDHLSPTDALSILRTLADSDAGLAARTAELSLTHLCQVDPEEVAAVLYDELDALEVEEVWEQAGRPPLPRFTGSYESWFVKDSSNAKGKGE